MKKVRNIYTDLLYEAIQYQQEKYQEIKSIIQKEFSTSIHMIKPNMIVTGLESPNKVTTIHPSDWILRSIGGLWIVIPDDTMKSNFKEMTIFET